MLVACLGAGLPVYLAACAATEEPPVISPTEANYLAPPAPVYPLDSRRKGEQGTVLLRVLVDAGGGKPRSVELLQSSGHPVLDQSALQAVRDARFQPYYRSGKASPFSTVIPIRFVIA